ncbi:hypothetical protein [Pontimicrobium sp. IMCC45349]|uniref:hypothetical protein n=1 Tax=Pontimicrobium sp. IMCC45349 TaxID=3391574 RepID=UPI0039A2E81E
MKKLIKVFILVMLLVGCKGNDKKEETINHKNNNEEVVKEVSDDNFLMTLNAKVIEDDTFTLFYMKDGDKAITKKNSISVKVVGSNEPQTIEFKLEDNVLPMRLFLKFKNEIKRQRIDILNASLSYEGEEFYIEGNRFFQFFAPNNYIEYDRDNATAIGKVVKDNYAPSFSSRKVLEDKIDFYLYK